MLFSLADYFILIILGLSILISIIRGFVKEALSLATWIAAFWVAFSFATDVNQLLAAYIHTPSMRYIVAFLLLFVAVMLLGNLIGFIIARMIDVTGLSSTDRFLGIFFGIGRGMLLVAILLLLASYTPLSKDPWWKESQLIPYFQPIQKWLKDLLPDTVNKRFEIIKETRPQAADIKNYGGS